MNQSRDQIERLLLENSPDVLWATDRYLKFTYISPGVRQLTGHNPADLIGRPIYDLVTSTSARLINDAFKKVRANRKPETVDKRHLELEFVHKNNTRVWGETTIAKLTRQSGIPAGFSGIIRDIDKWKRTESKLTRHRNDLE